MDTVRQKFTFTPFDAVGDAGVFDCAGAGGCVFGCDIGRNCQ